MHALARRQRSRPSQPYAVVIGLDCVTGLQTARILSRRGVPVVGIADDARHFACRTRLCERILAADTSGDELVDALLGLARELDEPAVLFPCTDQAVLALSRRRDALERSYHVLLPAAETVELLLDKIRFLGYAQE